MIGVTVDATIRELVAGDPLFAIDQLSFRYLKSRNPDYLEGCAALLPRLLDQPARFNGLLWGLQRMLFAESHLAAEWVERIRWEHVAPAYFQFVDQLFEALGNHDGPPLGSVSRVAYISHQLLELPHAPTKVCFDYTSRLIAHGHEVLVLNVNALEREYVVRFHGAGRATVNEKLPPKVQYAGQQIDVISALPPGMAVSKLEMLVQAVHQYRPGLVISHGEMNVVGDTLSHWYPTVCLPSGASDPITRAHGIGDYTGQMQEPVVFSRGHVPYPPLVCPLPNTTPLPNKTGAFTREQLGLDDQTLFLMAGSRLHREIDDHFEMALAQILERCPNSLLLLAGPEKFQWHHPDLAAADGTRIKCLGYQPNLRDWLGVADVYLNPPRHGGGVSAALAMAESLPILTLPGGDVAAVYGHTVPDLETLVETAFELATEPAIRKQWESITRDAFESQPTFDHVIRELVRFGKQVRSEFQQVAQPTRTSE